MLRSKSHRAKEVSISLAFDNKTGQMKCQNKYDLKKGFQKIDQFRADFQGED